MASFSRIQLAAALLEYDNDPDNPHAPRKSAYDSAIFAHLRRANGNIHSTKQEPQQSPNLLGVKLPSESGPPSEANMEMRRRSKSSIDMLHNPFGGDEEEEREKEEEEAVEVDLASWGLDSIMPGEKPSKKSKGAKGKAKSEILGKTTGTGPRPGVGRPNHSRTMSMPLAEFGEGGAFLDSGPSGRRNTISDPANFEEMGVLEKPGERQRFSSHPLIENLPVRPPLHSLSSFEQRRDTVPFPTSSSSPAAGQSEANIFGDSRSASRLNLLSEEESNPFAIPPPPPSRASRFDPKSMAHARTISNATRLSVGPSQQLAYDDDKENNYSHRAPSRASILDVKSTRDRRISTASFGTRDIHDDDFQSAYGGDAFVEDYPPRDRRYSRLDIMRPKVLVMPSPLQMQTVAPAPAPKVTRTKDGFLDSTDGRPMPPGARASHMSMIAPPSSGGSVPVAANSFTPNPRLSLTASQLLFRNTLMVDGQRDVSYNDIDGNLERAVEDGEQVKLDFPEEPERPAVNTATGLTPAEEAKLLARPPGKLFGRSLIDDLEARKQEMRSKQRVFTGDQRPSMMQRGSMIRSSTFIDQATLPARPNMPSRMPTTQTDTSLTRRGSRGGKPLLEINDDGKIAETTDRREARMAQTKSVFGVDTLWEREMIKLKEIEAQEEKDAEEARRREEEEEMKKAKKKKKKGSRARDSHLDVQEEASAEFSQSPTSPGAPSVSPQATDERPPSLSLPAIPVVTSRRRAVPEPVDEESDNESSASEAGMPTQNAAVQETQNAAVQEGLVDQWVSDDEKKPAEAPKVNFDKPRISLPPDDDSDEDLPLSMTLQRATQKLSSPRSQPDDDSDEDRPLSMMLLNKPNSSSSFRIPSSGPSEPNKSLMDDKDDDDDDVPLGIRASRLPPGASQISGISSLSVVGRGGNDDDDRPLSMHPSQLRKSQFQMLAQVQQQQQQMFQAQMTNSMMFPHPQSMMFMMPPQHAPFIQPTPVQQDTNKFSSVDRWRHDVAVEGQN